MDRLASIDDQRQRRLLGRLGVLGVVVTAMHLGG
jgi:hypothetical protein